MPQRLDMVAADLRDADGLARAIEGCSHVVNCALGDDRELVACMHNLVTACRKQSVARLVHLSSVTVYGDPPGPDCVHESGVPRPKRGSYGWFKLKQDDIALRACESGLPTAVLCLPHVTGPNSRFLLSVIRELRERRFALVDGGESPIVLADVRNVAQAIELALAAPRVDGCRIFINDGSNLRWRDLVERLCPMAAMSISGVPSVDRAQVLMTNGARLRLREALVQMLALPEVRAILQRTALGGDGGIAAPLRAIVKRRTGAAGHVAGRSTTRPAPAVPGPGLWRQQLRNVRHSTERAKAELGYLPEVDFDDSMKSFESWFSSVHQFGTPYWELARRI